MFAPTHFRKHQRRMGESRKVVTMPESSNGLYTFDIYAPNPEPGSILDLCQPFIEPMSERALAESQSPRRRWKTSAASSVTPP